MKNTGSHQQSWFSHFEEKIDVWLTAITCKLNLIIIFSALQEVLLPIDTPNIGNKDIWEEDFLFHVIDLTGYRLETRNLSFFSFHVRACADCALYLTDSEHVQNASELYSIYFGASRNNYSAIRLWRNKTGKQLTRTYGAFLDCNEFKSFWVSLNDGLLQFGKGQEAGTDVISTWLDPITINGVGIATGFGQTGRWKVPLSGKWFLQLIWNGLK